MKTDPGPGGEAFDVDLSGRGLPRMPTELDPAVAARLREKYIGPPEPVVIQPDPKLRAGYEDELEKAVAKLGKPVRWWHWLHSWTRWAEPEMTVGGALAAVFGPKAGPWWQKRHCVRCGKAQARRIERREDQ